MVSSSLKRAVETASEIEKATGIPISSVENGLKERYYGDYRSVTNISETPPDAESTEDFRKRVFQNLDKVFSEYHQACPLIIVSHQKVFEYVAELLSKRQESLTQGGIGHFIRNEDGTWQLDILDMAERAENRNTNIP